ncbi:hypothetical protein VV02_24585 [Luteipulveratus mongoliensis]|uniref:SalK n=1 Tax=Luteipulveratus mongoliensis TaxID=571913 RepID=A0A0K1JRV9_9MICO|nr:hypothetical protein VV02_24585 [Luteipulveratus mongoliensis]
MTKPSERARTLWQLLEPVHAAVYFAPETKSAYDAIGLKGYWMGYFASRAAALGPVGPEVVEAVFYVFHPAMVARALPDAWEAADPQTVLDARADIARTTLRRALGDQADSPEVSTAAEIAVRLALAAPRAGRPLGAAQAAVPVPDEPLDALWWAASVLREHRGDGHVAALTSYGIDPCEALVLHAATGVFGDDGAAYVQSMRKWPDEEWAAARERLVARNWVDPDGAITAAGHEARQAVEHVTDAMAATAYDAPDETLDRLETALTPLAALVMSTGAVPATTPVGIRPGV